MLKSPYKKLTKFLILISIFFGVYTNSIAYDNPGKKIESSSVDHDYKWTLVSSQADFRARDSMGEMIYKDKMWILGGWFDSQSAPPRDVWRSLDGEIWEMVLHQAPWKFSDFLMTIPFKEKMWVMGGWYKGRLEEGGATNEIWSSTNGVNWNLETPAASWSPRIGSGLVEFNGKIWLLGGTEDYYKGNESSLKNDVWSSTDGVNWDLVTNKAPWSPRAFLQAVVYDGKIWVMGGGNYVPEYQAKNDVWSSSDGINWELVTENAPWSPRIWFSSVVYRNCMWVIGGWSDKPSRDFNDVFFSKNGREWTQLKTHNSFSKRHEHSTLVFKDKIWVLGGHARPLNSEVWSLWLPQSFSCK
jgi:hypothetical protein